jgi:predicted nuclease with TOPRIM domain
MHLSFLNNNKKVSAYYVSKALEMRDRLNRTQDENNELKKQLLNKSAELSVLERILTTLQTYPKVIGNNN